MPQVPPSVDEIEPPVRVGCEDEEWYQRLPDHAKEEMRLVWEKRMGHSQEQDERRRRTTRRYLIEGVALFVVTIWLFYSVNLVVLLIAALVGGGVGALVSWRRARTYQYMLISGLGYVAFIALVGGWPSIFPFLFMICGGALLGLGHQLNRFDFTEL